MIAIDDLEALFGRFLDFVPTGTNAEKLPGRLTSTRQWWRSQRPVSGPGIGVCRSGAADPTDLRLCKIFVN
jgi:hypothetical protein